MSRTHCATTCLALAALIFGASESAAGGTLAPGGAALSWSAETSSGSLPGQATAQELLLKARLHAEQDEHSEAIAAFEAAFAADPDLIPLHAHELGHQLTWSEQPDQAVVWYERKLSAEPGHVEARIGLARALSWDDRLDAAVNEYRRVLIAHPDELEARLGEAQVVNWSGHHRSAAHLYSAILDDHPDHREARLGMAQSWAWAGYTSRALASLDPLRGDEEAAAMRGRIIEGHHPSLRLSSGISDDSDELSIVTNSLVWEAQTPRFQNLRLGMTQRLFQQSAQPDVKSYAFTVGGSVRTGEATALNLYLTAHRFRSDDPIINGGSAENLDFDLFGYDLWFTWWASSRWRWDFSSDRGFVDTPRSLSYDLAVNSFGLSTDLQLAGNVELSAMAKRSLFSDENSRSMGAVSLGMRWGSSWEFGLRPGITAFRFDDSAERGYWNPPEFFKIGVASSLEGDLGERLEVGLEASTGREYAEDEDYGVFAFAGRLGWRLSSALLAEAAGGHSDSKLSGAGGFNRSWATVALRVDF